MVEEFLYFSADDSLVLFGHRPLLLPPTFPGGLAIPLTMTADNEGVNTLPGAQQQKGSSRKPDFRQIRFSETQRIIGYEPRGGHGYFILRIAPGRVSSSRS